MAKCLSAKRWSLCLFPFLVLVSLLVGCHKGQVAQQNHKPLGKVMVYYQVPDISEPLPVAVNIYRCSNPDGPFVQVNQKPIVLEKVKRGDLCELYTDRSVFLGEVYYYYLVSIDRQGKAGKITSTTKVLVTVPLEKPKKQRGNKTEKRQAQSR